jgi:hypothetical protein
VRYPRKAKHTPLMHPNTAIHKPHTAYRGISFFTREKRLLSAGIQKNIEKMIRIAASTPYSPFCQKNVEAANNKGAIIKQNPSTLFSS